MEDLLDIIAVTPLKEWKLLLKFENGEEKIFDMTSYKDQMPYKKLLNNNLFMQAQISYGTVTWPFNIDIAPEVLYENSTTLNH